MEWILENKEWVFSGIGIFFISFLVKKKTNKKRVELTAYFYKLAFVSLIIFLAVDYCLNYDQDWRLRVLLLVGIFCALWVIDNWLSRLKNRFQLYKAVASLTTDECLYVVRCYEGKEFIQFEMDLMYPLDSKWHYILYIPTASRVLLHRPYKICVYAKAYRLIVKKLKKADAL